MKENTQTLINAEPGDEIHLDRYIKSGLTVTDVQRHSAAGIFILAASSGGTTYRLRGTYDHEDRLVMEKQEGDVWKPFIRVDTNLRKK